MCVYVCLSRAIVFVSNHIWQFSAVLDIDTSATESENETKTVYMDSTAPSGKGRKGGWAPSKVYNPSFRGKKILPSKARKKSPLDNKRKPVMRKVRKGVHV